VQPIVDGARRPLPAGVLVGLALLCLPSAASADRLTTASAAADVVVVERGDRGAAVRQVQAALDLPADGVFGPQTERAVKRFQRDRGLLVDGIVGPQTRAALGLAPFGRGSVKERERRSGSVGVPRVLHRIAECESGGDPRAVSAGGHYRGKYQFSVDTWRNLGGRGDPAAAPEWRQDRIALKLYRRAGTSPWPNCA
jgi:hypothetical protein